MIYFVRSEVYGEDYDHKFESKETDLGKVCEEYVSDCCEKEISCPEGSGSLDLEVRRDGDSEWHKFTVFQRVRYVAESR